MIHRPTRRSALTLAAGLLALATVAHAAEPHDHDHDHGAGAHAHEPRYGGIVEEAGGLDYELVVSGGVVRLYVDSHDGKAVTVKGGKANITFLKDGQSTRLALAPAGGNWFEAQGTAPTGKGMRAVAVVQLAGKTTSVRFATP